MVDPIPVASPRPGSSGNTTPPLLRHSPSVISTRAYPYGPTTPHEGPMQISTRVSQFTGAVSTSPPTPTAGLVQLPGMSRAGSPGGNGTVPLPSTSASGSSISTTYTTYFRSASPAASGLQNTHQNSYRDPRGSVRAYFSIASPSACGASMTVFRSVPDDFAIDGSWGWRSSACVEIPDQKSVPESGSGSPLSPSYSSSLGANRANGAGHKVGAMSNAPGDKNADIRQWLRELASVRAMIVIGLV